MDDPLKEIDSPFPPEVDIGSMQEPHAAKDINCAHVMLMGQSGFRGPDHSVFECGLICRMWHEEIIAHGVRQSNSAGILGLFRRRVLLP